MHENTKSRGIEEPTATISQKERKKKRCQNAPAASKGEAVQWRRTCGVSPASATKPSVSRGEANFPLLVSTSLTQEENSTVCLQPSILHRHQEPLSTRGRGGGGEKDSDEAAEEPEQRGLCHKSYSGLSPHLSSSLFLQAQILTQDTSGWAPPPPASKACLPTKGDQRSQEGSLRAWEQAARNPLLQFHPKGDYDHSSL